MPLLLRRGCCTSRPTLLHCTLPRLPQVTMHVKARGFASPGQAAALVIGIVHTHRAALEYLALLRENEADAVAEGAVTAGGDGAGKAGGGTGNSTGRRMAAASTWRRLLTLEREAAHLFGGLNTMSATTDI